MSKNHRLVLRIQNPIRNTTVMSFDQGSYSVTGQNITLTEIASSGEDSRAGDEAALESLYSTLNEPNLTGWSSNMSLSDDPEGITAETVNSELRVTKIDLRNKGLTGNIEINNWGNLKECGYVNLTFNSLNTQIPQGLIDLPKNEYLYLCKSDTGTPIEEDAHEEAASGGGDVHTGKSKGSENNVYTGAVPAPSDTSSLILKWFILNFTDTHRDTQQDGISHVPTEIFDIPTLVGIQIYVNANLQNTTFPQGIANLTDLDNFAFPGGFDNVTGTVPDIGGLSNLRFARLGGSDFITFNFDDITWSGLTSLKHIGVTSNDITGTTVPEELFDGTMSEIFQITAAFPFDGVGLGGAFPEVAAGLNGGIGYKIVQFRHHSITSLPASLWNNSPAIIQLDFTDNELTTIGTSDLSNMGSLRYLRLSSNELHEDAPYLPWDNHLSQGIELSNNRYVFKHLLYVPPNAPDGETLLELYQTVTDAGELTYASQKPFGSEDDYDSGTSTIDFSSIVTHTDNSYTWQRSTDDGSTFNAISGETGNTLDVSTYDAGDQFYLEVTNSLEASIGEGATFNSVTITI